MKFSKMPYERLDLEKTKSRAAELTAALCADGIYAGAKKVFLEWQTLSSSIRTTATLSSIRHTINTQDSFYAAEKDYYDEISPILQELDLEFTKAMLKSPFRADFMKEYGPLYFKNAEIELRSFDSKIIPDLQEENKTVSEYIKLVASAQVEFDGKTLTLSELEPYKQSSDSKVRQEAWNAFGEFYSGHGEQFDDIYDRLVKIRTRIAKSLGHETFTPLGYDRMTRNSYDANDVDKFRQAVVKYLVPVVTKLKEEQAKRTGADFPLTIADDALQFKNGNASPCGTPDEIMAHGLKMYRELSPETAEFMDIMIENELFDVLSRKGKASGGYCTSLPDYHVPFIFANFNGTSHDVGVLTHEAGHAFASFMARDIMPLENRHPTAECCEIHSMSMEFFAWPWCEGFFGEQTQKFYYQHLEDSLTFIPYGTMVDHFQHEIYKNPGLSPAERHKLWAGLESVYRPWLKDDKTAMYKDGRQWQRQLHIYEYPFYYIDYCLAQTVALQFWAAIQKDRQSAWERYLTLTNKAGTLTFKELVASADMASPFGDTALKEVADAAVTWLEGFDTTKLEA